MRWLRHLGKGLLKPRQPLGLKNCGYSKRYEITYVPLLKDKTTLFLGAKLPSYWFFSSQSPSACCRINNCFWPNYSSDCGCMWDWIGVSVKHLFVSMDTNWYSQSSFFASGWVWIEERLLHCRRRLGFGLRRTELGRHLNCDVVECRIRSLVLTSTLHSPFYAECLNQVVCIHFFLIVQRMKSVQVVSKHGCCLEFHIYHLFSIGTANTVHRCVGWMSLGWRENVSFQFQFRIPSTVII